MYNDASEALRLLEERDRHTRIKAAIAIGDDQNPRGGVHAWTADSLNELKREAGEEDRRQLPISDDVHP